MVLDFETTGLCADCDRTIEVAAALIIDGSVVKKHATFMDQGCAIPVDISQLIGITTAMVRGKPKPEKVMPLLKEFIGKRPVVAHNSLFDGRFLNAEMERAGRVFDLAFLCTMKLSRCLIPDSPDYKLGLLARHLGLRKSGSLHRAAADVDLTGKRWLHLIELIVDHCTGDPAMAFMAAHKINDLPKSKVAGFLKSLSKPPSKT